MLLKNNNFCKYLIIYCLDFILENMETIKAELTEHLE